VGIRKRKDIMNNIGTSELIVILIIALLVFGPKKLPEIARSIGRGIFKLKQEFNNLKDTMDEEVEGNTGTSSKDSTSVGMQENKGIKNHEIQNPKTNN